MRVGRYYKDRGLDPDRLKRSMKAEFEQNDGGAWLKEYQYVVDERSRAEYPSTKGATDDPRDARWFDRLVRWMLNHPYLLAALILLAVVVLFTVLLILGPPVPKA